MASRRPARRARTLAAGLTLALAPLLHAQGTGTPPNVLLILADDVGVDRVGAYGEHPAPGRTPVLDQLAAEGVLFRNAWAMPSCSPTRAALLTGRYAFRTGIGRPLALSATLTDPAGMPLSETTLAELLAPTHTSYAVGKWHLAVEDDPLSDPLDQGFAHHRGSFSNLSNGTYGDAYTNWVKHVDGVPRPSTTYATTDSVDEALAAIQGAGGPWFVYLAFNAPHGPFHAPPDTLHSFDLPDVVADDVPLHVLAMIEAMDTELGRLFAALGPAVLDDTLVIFAGDNGTAGLATTPPFVAEHAKGTLYEGGVNVPLIVRGPGVTAGATCEGLVQLTDVYATLGELAGVPVPGGEDSVSLVPYLADPARPSLRATVYAERFSPLGPGPWSYWDQAVRDGRYKLIRRHAAPVSAPDAEELYDLLADPFEQVDLLARGALSLEQEVALAGLRAALHELVGPWILAGDGVAGAAGVPELLTAGTLLAGEPVTVGVAGGAPSVLGVVVLGLAPLYAPFKGGLFVPMPHLFLIVPLDAAGAVSFGFTWPAGIPAGFETWWQGWIPDVAAPAGFAATTAVVGVTP